MTSAELRVVSLHSDMGGEGLCPICHLPREKNGCSTSWTTDLQSGNIGMKGWRGHFSAFCSSFPDDRERLSEALNRYHVRKEDEK